MIEIAYLFICSLGWVLMLRLYKELKSLRKVLIKISVFRGYHLDENHCSKKEYKEAEDELIRETRGF